MIHELFININFWSAFSGLTGAVFIFFWGIPSRIDPNGGINLICEQEDTEEKKLGKKYKKLSYIGLFLLGLSFFLQIVNLLNQS